jgi:thiol peroxidase
MAQRTITMKGRPLVLSGNAVNVGDKAPDFEVVGRDLSLVKFSSFAGKVCIISSTGYQRLRYNDAAI